MTTFILKIGPLEMGYDEDYGINHRSGWFIKYDGTVCCQFEPSLFRAFREAWPDIRMIRRFKRENPPE